MQNIFDQFNDLIPLPEAGPSYATRLLGPTPQRPEPVPPLAQARAVFSRELQDPAVSSRLAAVTQAEVGGQGPQAQQAFIETIMNRAASRGQTLAQTLTGGYFPPVTHQRAERYASDPSVNGRYSGMIGDALGGSNVGQFATGNASGTVGFNGGPQVSAYGGERFGIEGPDRAWVQRMRQGDPMAYTAQPPKTAGVQAIESAIRPVPGADPIPPRPQFGGQASPWQDGVVQSMPAPPVQRAQPNIFDQFDSPAPSQGAAPNIFDQFDEPQQDAQPAPAGPWNNATAGLNDAIYSTLGAPVDAATWITNKAVQGINAVTGAELPQARTNLPGSSRWLAGAGEAVGVNDPSKVQAATIPDKLARAAGAGVGGMVAPEAALGALNRAGVVGKGAMNTLGSIFGRSASVGDVATNAAVGAAAGVGGQMAGQVVPEPWKPLAETAGNLVGGAAGAGAIAAGRGAAQLPQAWRDFRLSDPATQEAAAGARLRQAATDPAAVRDALDAAAASKTVGLPTEPGAVPRNLVAGSEPTTFQLTGDMGLGGLERASASQNPAEFMQRRADQNAARVGALEGIQPKGAPEQVVGVLRQNLAALDEATGHALTGATNAAREAAGRLGGEGAPEAYGAGIRQQIMDARGAAKERERALWKAVDPGNDLNLPATGVRDTARTIVKGLEKSAAPLAGEERAAIATALRYPDVVPFREMTALRSRVSDAMRQEMVTNGQTRVYARLSQLRGAIERDIEGAVASKAAMEQQAVQAGAMSEEDTMAAHIQGWADNWYDRRSSEAQMGQSFAEGAGSDARAGSTAFSPGSGAAGQGRGRSGQAPGGERVQSPGLFPDNLAPNFDEGAAGRLKAASAATKQRAQTFDAGRVGAVTRRSGASGPFQTEASVVPGRFFLPGPRGFEAMQALRNAAPEALPQIRDYAISTLRKAAESPLDGTLDPAKVQAWRQKHADALRAMPEVDRMLADPVQASETMARLAAERKAQLDAFEQGAVARLLRVEDPADVTRTIGGIFSRQDAVQQMGRLARETAGSEEARQGLRKAVADYVNLRFIGNTEGATSGADMMRSDAFQQFLRQSVPALKTVLSGPEIMTLHAIAADLKRSNRSVAAVKLPGQSNTVQDALAVGQAGGAQSWLSRLLSPGALASAGAAAGSMASGGLGAAAGAGGGAHLGRVIEAMRQAGLASVDDIVKDALLNPERARALLAKVPDAPTRGQAISLARVYMRAGLLPGSDGENKAPQPQRGSAPRPPTRPAAGFLPPPTPGGLAGRLLGVGP
ncbi:UNVERIFIED_ORG: hypothetical protein ABID33_003866 [Xanthobacter viscosus]|uniref:Uncharacterized protein n=1 Tax=Xanthobacter autotrophicus TaxID=280 RepID=A0A6C1KUI4_XANAU|nr:hypothetical protein [Xanthobacter autotrophicus]TLX44476.1 hypothetical protein FBQ73_02550 [Xanthobacter autotrophicus]